MITGTSPALLPGLREKLSRLSFRAAPKKSLCLRTGLLHLPFVTSVVEAAISQLRKWLLTIMATFLPTPLYPIKPRHLPTAPFLLGASSPRHGHLTWPCDSPAKGLYPPCQELGRQTAPSSSLHTVIEKLFLLITCSLGRF